MDEFEIEVAGRISALEFVLEVLLANNLALMDQSESALFKNDLVSRPGRLTRGPVDADLVQAIRDQTHAALTEFIGKVAAREAKVRDVIG